MVHTDTMHVIHARAAGLDVHKMEITATVRLARRARRRGRIHRGVQRLARADWRPWWRGYATTGSAPR